MSEQQPHYSSKSPPLLRSQSNIQPNCPKENNTKRITVKGAPDDVNMMKRVGRSSWTQEREHGFLCAAGFYYFSLGVVRLYNGLGAVAAWYFMRLLL